MKGVMNIEEPIEMLGLAYPSWQGCDDARFQDVGIIITNE